MIDLSLSLSIDRSNSSRTKRDERARARETLACLSHFLIKSSALSRWEMYTIKDGENTHKHTLPLSLSEASRGVTRDDRKKRLV